MDQEIIDKIHDLGQVRYGRLVRIAYNMSLGMTKPEACVAEGVAENYLWAPNQKVWKEKVEELADLLAASRYIEAQEQSIELLKDGATEAVLVLLKQLRHPKAKIAADAANSILDRLGVHEKGADEPGLTVRLDLGEAADRALEKIYGRESDGDNSN